MTGSVTTVQAATLVAPRRLEVREYPYPAVLEPGAVLLRTLASGICGTDKHTYRGENYGNSLTSALAPHLFGGWSEYL